METSEYLMSDNNFRKTFKLSKIKAHFGYSGVAKGFL